jgi:branched-chain amino acid transport system ATP-binding protein
MSGDEHDGLRCRGLTVAFGGNRVLTDIDFDATPGFNGLIGPNGAGKTTLFNVITGYVRATAGKVFLGDAELTSRRRSAIARLGVARTFQTPKLIQEMAVLDNVLLGIDGQRRLRDWDAVLGLPRSERAARTRALDLLGEFGLDGYATGAVSALPLGSQKVVEVVRALLSNPRLLLLDEPAAGVSVEDVQHMTDPLDRWVKRTNMCLVIIEHDLELVSRLCRTVTVLDFGRVIAKGSPHDVTNHPDVITAYLGASFAAESV